MEPPDANKSAGNKYFPSESDMRPMNRRSLLRLIGVLAVGSIAGCGDGQSEDGPGTPTDAPPPTESPTPTRTPTETATEASTETATPTATPTATQRDAAQVVTVGEDGFRFDPDSFEISVGETAVWVWLGSNHNVVPNDIPDDSTWDGTAGGPDETYDSGHEHQFTFETPGSYTYYCNPHRSAGMTGAFSVVE